MFFFSAPGSLHLPLFKVNCLCILPFLSPLPYPVLSNNLTVLNPVKAWVFGTPVPGLASLLGWKFPQTGSRCPVSLALVWQLIHFLVYDRQADSEVCGFRRYLDGPGCDPTVDQREGEPGSGRGLREGMSLWLLSAVSCP